MIKKYLLGLLLFVGVGLTSFSSAWEYHLIGSDYSSSQNSSYNVGVISNGNLKTSYLGQDKSIFFLDGGENSHFFYWTTSNEPYIFSSLSWGMPYRNVKEGIPPSFFVCDEITSSSSITDGPGNCGYSQSLDSVDLSSFFNSLIVGVDYYGYNIVSNVGALRQQDFFICFSSSFLGQSICFNTIGFNGDSYYMYDLTGSLDYGSLGADLGFGSILDSNVGFSPAGGGGGSSSGGNGNILDITNSDYIGYFENRAVESFNVFDCYVGTDDLVSPYGTAGLSFNYGKGKTIFDLFNSLHGTGSGSEYLSNVATWTRTWKLNYGNWFDRNAVGYMGVFSIYTGGGVEFLPRDYTGFIFSGRPASLYFMSNNLYNKFGFYGDTFELVGYCDMKLNGTPFNQVFSTGSATYNNVLGATYSNYYNTQYYVDGSGNLVLSRDPGDFNIYLSEWLDYEGSGEDYSDYFAGFNEFYSKLDEKFSNINLSNSVGIIPEYILFALFGIILFKIFKH